MNGFFKLRLAIASLKEYLVVNQKHFSDECHAGGLQYTEKSLGFKSSINLPMRNNNNPVCFIWVIMIRLFLS